MKKSFIFSALVIAGIVFGIVMMFFSSRQNKDLCSVPMATTPQTPSLVATTSQPIITIKDIVLKERGKDKHYELMVKAKESTVHHATDTIECTNVSCNVTINS